MPATAIPLTGDPLSILKSVKTQKEANAIRDARPSQPISNPTISPHRSEPAPDYLTPLVFGLALFGD